VRKLLQPRLGRAAFGELARLAEGALAWAQAHFDPAHGPFKPFLIMALRRAYARLLQKYGRRRLQLEWADERLRAQVGQSDEHLLRYLLFAERMILAAAGTRPGRWYVATKSRSELVADLRTEIWIALSDGTLALHERVGVAASLSLAGARVRRWKKDRRIREVQEVTDQAPLPETTAAMRDEPQQLSVLLQEESKRTAREALDRFKARASRIQRQWLAAMELDVRSYGTLNMERVAQQLVRGRSAGARMRAKLRSLLGSAWQE